MQEWLNWLPWKGSVSARVPWVRIPLSPQMYYAYILQSQKDGSYYYGSAENIIQRLDQHNHGKVRYTKGHIPYKLHYSEELSLRSEAVQREKFFKSIAGYRWLRKEGIIK